MKTKDLLINLMNKLKEHKAYTLKRGYKFFKNYKRTEQTIADILLTMAENNKRMIQGLIK